MKVFPLICISVIVYLSKSESETKPKNIHDSFSLFLYIQEREIQNLSAEIESLKNSQNLNASARLDELRGENSRLKYRLNILKRVSDRAAGVSEKIR